MKLGVVIAVALATLTIGCTETGRRGYGGYSSRTVVVDRGPHYDRRVVERRVVERRVDRDRRYDRDRYERDRRGDRRDDRDRRDRRDDRDRYRY